MSAHLPAIAEVVRERRLVVFCGAGVSMLAPSHSPSWWEIYVSAAQALAERLIEAFPEIAPDLRVDELLAPMTTQQLADLVFSRFAGPTFSELLKVVDIADANENHRALATLAKIGGLRAAITTNFDTLIERAAAVRGVRFAIAAPGIPALRQPGDHAVLVKLHGSTVEPSSMIETTSQKARDISPTLRAAWLPALAGADLLVVGYSGADLNFGAARAFFADVLAAGSRIWWLCFPGSQPTLTPAVAARTTLVEGRLPDLLRELLTALGETDYATPVTGRDAKAALSAAMRTWSLELHIGAWAAASFYLSLCRRSAANQTAGTLLAALLQIARKQLPRFEPGSALDIQDLTVAGFLDGAGMHLLEHKEAAGAAALLRASVNIYNAVDTLLGGAQDDRSYAERHMNLSSSWNNYAQACLLSGETATAFQAFLKALEHAYLAGKVDSFLISLDNLLHYGFALRLVRRSLRIAQSAVALADRVGAVQSSISLRLFLALYACDRSEIWQAARLLEEAHRRAAAIGSQELQNVAEIQLGECAIRSGRVAEGLARIGAVVSSRPGTVFLFRTVEETRRYLKTLGSEQPVPFQIRLEPNQVPALAAKIEAERAAARQNQALPWGGAHCAISESSHLGPRDGAAMVRIGCLEFEGNADGATEEGLKLAEYLVSAELTVDAAWAAQNLLARPGLPVLRQGRALAVLAHCAAAAGQIDEARQHLKNAESCFAATSVPLPGRLAEVGLWLAVQVEDAAAALPWAERLADDLSTQPQGLNALVTLVAQIESWGPSMQSVVSVLRERLARAGLEVPASTQPHPSAKFRRFPGVTASTEPGNEAARQAIARAQQALAAENPQKALACLDELAKLGKLPEHQAGPAIELQAYAMAAMHPPEKVEAFALVQRRRLLGSLAFGTLAHLELALVRLDLLAERYPMARERLRQRGWIGELSEEAIPRARLRAWEALMAELAGGQGGEDERSRESREMARYFGVPEADLETAGDVQPASDPQPDFVAERVRSLATVFASNAAEEEVDRALAETVHQLRKARRLRRDTLARLRGDRANCALRRQRFKEAERGYLQVERSFRALGLLPDALQAMAGRARALSRSGEHAAAVQVFERAIQESPAGTGRANLLLGLGSAHLLEASRRDDGSGSTLRAAAVAVCRRAIEAAPLHSRERANARLALARAFGEQGEQEAALAALDLAIAELAHQGSPTAKLLQEHRDQFVAGHWQSLGLM